MPVALDARVVSDHFPGIGRYVANLARSLPVVAPELDLVLITGGQDSGSLTLPAVPQLRCAASPFSLRQQWAVPAALARLHADLYHSAFYLMPYWPRVPAVVTCYDLIPLLYPDYFSPTRRAVYALAHRLAIARAGAILAISETTRADLVRLLGVASERVHVTPLAADPRFRPLPAERLAGLRAERGLPERYVLYVGSNKPHKNLVGLVRAFARLCGNGEAADVALLVAGPWDGRYPEAKLAAEREGIAARVRFLGPVPDADLPALYGAAAVFAFPSEYEGFGLPVLEAMACGTPVVCGRTSSLAELVADAALLVDPLDVEALGEALARGLADEGLRAALRQRGLARAAAFSWERTAAETLSIYQRVAPHALSGRCGRSGDRR
jgi:glycosyltransferase involved in cell wall biosynthesis